MLPQLLVQNRLLGDDSSTQFVIDWDRAAPVVDVNFYYTWRLIDESYYYRAAQYPWTKVDYSATGQLEPHQYWIQPDTGKYDYCVSENKIVTLTPVYYVYNYDEHTQQLYRSSDITLPVYLRSAVCFLNSAHTLSLIDAVADNNILTFSINANNYIYPFTTNRLLRLETDVLFGRVMWHGGTDATAHCLANVPVTIHRAPDSTNTRYLYTISIPDQDFPRDAYLELY